MIKDGTLCLCKVLFWCNKYGKIGLEYFDRVCINIMVENGTKIKPDKDVINIFTEDIHDIYVNNPRVDILMHNTDFGVG